MLPLTKPACCIAADQFSETQSPDRAGSGPSPTSLGFEPVISGILYKWTNYTRRWRKRWFSIHNGVIFYYKIVRKHDGILTEGNGVRLIGENSVRFLSAEKKEVGAVNVKVSSFRESRSDDRRFFIFTPTKSLYLRSYSKEDRTSWIEALVSARSLCSLRSLSYRQNVISFSTVKLRDRMHIEGIGEALIDDCEKIMRSEISEIHRQIKLQHDEHLNLLGPFEQHLEISNAEGDTATIHKGQFQLIKNEFSCSGRGKYSEYSTTESDDVEKQELDIFSDEDIIAFYDTKERFSNYDGNSSPLNEDCKNMTNFWEKEMTHIGENHDIHNNFPHVKRRNALPEPLEKEKGVSLWSIIKDSIGKDLTRVCLPVYFNEPLSSLQKCFEEMEYSYLLDRAYEYGKSGNSLMRILNVAAFAVSAYASSDGRHRKPFNPLLGETYEAEYPDKGIRFFSEKVSHSPMVIACHCEGKGWNFSGDSNLKSKFWGRSIQLDPVGILTLEFDDGEIFTWSKVTTSIYNLILGKLYCDHHGIMNIQGNRQYSCKLKFKEQSLLGRNPRQVQGFVEDTAGNKAASLMGNWDDSMYCVIGDESSRLRTQNPSLLWKRSKPPSNPTRYNLSSFAITLNELNPELLEKLPPTDSRLRPDQRHLENGEYEKANEEKLRLEQRQRLSRKLQENGWRPRWFHIDDKDGSYRYAGGYWGAREGRKWEECWDIFGENSYDRKMIEH